MFVHTCTACAKRQLIFPSQISSVTNTDHGILVSYTCWCGAEQSSPLEWAPVEPLVQAAGRGSAASVAA